MSVSYPWGWLAGALGGVFSVRYGWLDQVLRSSRQSDAACLLIPRAAGGLGDWSVWLADEIDREARVPCLRVPGSLDAAVGAVRSAYGIAGIGATELLSQCRRAMPHAEPVPLVVENPDPRCTEVLAGIVAEQRKQGYPFLRPLLVRRAPPPHWPHEIIRFGAPEASGHLHRIAPAPTLEPRFWTNVVLALTAIWEAGATPPLAEDLWLQLQATRRHSLLDAGFDAWLAAELDRFGHGTAAMAIPSGLAFNPAAEVNDELWQEGIVAWQEGAYDIVPLHARRWVGTLAPDAAEAVRRRRLTNVPLARWLSAWATSVEESLRIAALKVGSGHFRRFLEKRPARRDGGSTRWVELSPAGAVDGVDLAELSDLVAFIAQSSPSVFKVLDDCRKSRNAVVHERRLRVSDLVNITRAISWLTEQGLL